MPKGPSGQKRPTDVTQNAVLVMKIATGEVEEKTKVKTVSEEAGGTGTLCRIEPD